jgi:hypothetical protein
MFERPSAPPNHQLLKLSAEAVHFCSFMRPNILLSYYGVGMACLRCHFLLVQKTGLETLARARKPMNVEPPVQDDKSVFELSDYRVCFTLHI